ncbi:MAG: cytochrome C oxidase subunit IV family protein [Thaumarchaeota archaeon]|nr:cytochrome C oxidase subunit IV family protein [Nitrososphaerota archaeon]
MKQSTAIGVWASLVAASVIEVGLFEYNKGTVIVDVLIGLIAASNAVITAMYSMDLKEENTAVKYLFLIPVLLVAVLIITLLLSFPVIE